MTGMTCQFTNEVILGHRSVDRRRERENEKEKEISKIQQEPDVNTEVSATQGDDEWWCLAWSHWERGSPIFFPQHADPGSGNPAKSIRSLNLVLERVDLYYVCTPRHPTGSSNMSWAWSERSQCLVSEAETLGRFPVPFLPPCTELIGDRCGDVIACDHRRNPQPAWD